MQVWEFRSKEVFTKEYAVEYLLEHMQTDMSRVLAIHIRANYNKPFFIDAFIIALDYLEANECKEWRA
jgi:hypothetical protein